MIVDPAVCQKEAGPKPASRRSDRKKRSLSPHFLQADFRPAFRSQLALSVAIKRPMSRKPTACADTFRFARYSGIGCARYSYSAYLFIPI